MCANTTMGVLCFNCFTSSSSHSSCSWPSVPSPPAFRFMTLTSPIKCAPFLSKLYHPPLLLPFPKGSRTRPSHALQESPPVDPVVVMIVQNFVFHRTRHFFLLEF